MLERKKKKMPEEEKEKTCRVVTSVHASHILGLFSYLCGLPLLKEVVPPFNSTVNPTSSAFNSNLPLANLMCLSRQGELTIKPLTDVRLTENIIELS